METITLKELTHEDLQRLAIWKVPVQIQAGDLLEIFTNIARYTAAMRDKDTTQDNGGMLTMEEAMKEYKACEATLIKRAKEGLIKGEKIGNRWYFEPARARRERMARLEN